MKAGEYCTPITFKLFSQFKKLKEINKLNKITSSEIWKDTRGEIMQESYVDIFFLRKHDESKL